MHHLNSVWRGSYGRCTYLVLCLYHACTPCTCQHGYCTYLPALVLVLYLYRRTVCTVLCLLYNESASPCSYSYCGYTIAQCVPCLYLLYSSNGLAWLARVMCLLPVFCFFCSYRTCTIAQSGRVMYVLPVCTRAVLWLYPCTVCTVLVYFTRCTRTVSVLLHSRHG